MVAHLLVVRFTVICSEVHALHTHRRSQALRGFFHFLCGWLIWETCVRFASRTSAGVRGPLVDNALRAHDEECSMLGRGIMLHYTVLHISSREGLKIVEAFFRFVFFS